MDGDIYPDKQDGIHMAEQLLTYKEASARMRLSEPTIRKLIYQGLLRVKYVGRAVRIFESSIDTWMNSNTQPAVTDARR